MALSRTDYMRLADHIAYHRSKIEAGQLKVSISGDMAGFARIRRSLNVYLHPVFDLEWAYIAEGDAFWLAVTDSEDEAVACVAIRRLRGELRDIFMSRQIWMDRPSLEPFAPLDLEWPDDMPEICGVVAFEGGLYTHPRARGNRIGIHLVHLIRAISLRSWRQDWTVGIVRQELHKVDMHGRWYRLPHAARSFSRRPAWPDQLPQPTLDEEWIGYISRREMLAQLAESPQTVIA